MGQELQKAQTQDAQIAIYKRLYSAAWETAFNEFMFLMGQQYRLELLIEVPGGQQVPSPMVKFWRESLKDLSPNEMREALRGYMMSERSSFAPTIGEILENVPDGTAKDKPRLVINPDCQDCKGTAWKPVPGKFNTVTRCHCPKVVYAGQEYPWASPERQLPAAPMKDEEDQAAKQLVNNLGAVPHIKRFPQARSMSDADYNQRKRELERQKAQILKDAGGR